MRPSTLTPIIDAVKQAVTLTRQVAASGIDPNAKDDDSPVTIADYGAQALISRAIATHFPQDAVVAEETGDGFRALVGPGGRAQVVALLSALLAQPVTEEQVIRWLDHGQVAGPGGATWVIDPIDGTVGFVNGRYYAVCVGRLVDGQPRQGVMGLPRSPLDDAGTVLYTEGDGVVAAALDGSHTRSVQASPRTRQAGLRVTDSFKIPQADRDLNAAIRQAAGVQASSQPELYDSQIKYAMIAAGHSDVFIRLPRDIAQEPHYIWDHAPGAALLQAAGAAFTDLHGNPVVFSEGKTLPHTGFIASNGTEHAALVAAAIHILEG